MSKNLVLLPKPTEWEAKLLERYDEGVRLRARVELAIVRKLIETLIAGEFQIFIDDGGDEYAKVESNEVEAYLDAIFAVEEARIYLRKDGAPAGFVYLVMGNDGWDVICDYATRLDEVLKPVNDYADQLAEAAS